MIWGSYSWVFSETGGALEASDLMDVIDHKKQDQIEPEKQRDGIKGKLGDFSMSGLSASNMVESNFRNQAQNAYAPEQQDDENSLESRLAKIRMGLNMDYKND